jgi:protocatechuate 4,5-dioxygenase alpha subunit
MALEKPYLDVPGTTIFDAEQSRIGYHLNMFCMSLMKAENRERFKADQRAYIDEWPMTEEQKQAALDFDLNKAIKLGGNILSCEIGCNPWPQFSIYGCEYDRANTRTIFSDDDCRRPLGRWQSLHIGTRQ